MHRKTSQGLFLNCSVLHYLLIDSITSICKNIFVILFDIVCARQKAVIVKVIFIFGTFTRERFGKCLGFFLSTFQWSIINNYIFLFFFA